MTSPAAIGRPSAAIAEGSPAVVEPRSRRFHWYVRISGSSVFCWTSGARTRAATSRRARPARLAAPAVITCAACERKITPPIGSVGWMAAMEIEMGLRAGCSTRCTKRRTDGVAGQRAGRKR